MEGLREVCNIYTYLIVLVSVENIANVVSDEYNFSYCMETSAIRDLFYTLTSFGT